MPVNTLSEEAVIEHVTQIRTLTPPRDPLVAIVKEPFSKAFIGSGNLPEEILVMRGMSGRKYRLFINNLVRNLKDTSYLEVGSWTGSTLCSAINENTVRATAIDNWTGFGGPKAEFMENLAKFKTRQAHVNFVEKDFRDVDFSLLGKFRVHV
jgi:hypothetical protein